MSLPMNHNIKKFTQEICAQIKYRKIHESISKELENHILEQTDAYIKEGFLEECAIKKAVLSMGDPIEIGKQMNQIHRPKPEWSVIFTTIILLALGFFINHLQNDTSSIPNTVFLMLAGAGALLFTYFMDYTIIKKYIGFIYFFVLITGLFAGLFSVSVNGMRSFIAIGGLRIYNYYILLIAIPLYAAILYKMRNSGLLGLIICVCSYVPFLFIGLSISATGTLILTFSCFATTIAALYKKWFGIFSKKNFILLCFFAVFVLLFLFYTPSFLYRIQRLKIMFFPEQFSDTYGYMGTQIRQIILGAKAFGQTSYPPSSYFMADSIFQNDFILTNIISHYGYAAGIFITGFILLLLYRLFLAVSKLKNKLGFFISFSIAMALSLQYLFYLLPNWGIVFFPLKNCLLFQIAFGA